MRNNFANLSKVATDLRLKSIRRSISYGVEMIRFVYSSDLYSFLKLQNFNRRFSKLGPTQTVRFYSPGFL